MRPNFNNAGYEIDIIVQGFPGKSVCHGALGWSTIVLLRGHGKVALIDVGAFGIRKELIERLAEHGLKPADVTDVLLTHSHFDHSVNWTLFRDARIVIGGEELDWSLGEPWGETPVPELYVEALNTWPTLSRCSEGDEVLPGITAHLAPGHTPGCLIFVLKGRDADIVFTGDAAKNRAELISRDTDMTYDPAVSAASIARIWDYWTARPGTIVVPGHDLPMTLENGAPRYIGTREAAIRAWYDETLEKTTVIRLTVD